MEQQVFRNYITNPLKQQKFVPLILEAENKIKVLIMSSFWLGKPKTFLMLQIMAIIKRTADRFPKDILDKQVYINGLYGTANRLLNEFYNPMKVQYQSTLTRLQTIYNGLGKRMPRNITNPKQLFDFIEKKTGDRIVWQEAKGVPYIENYQNIIKKRVKEIANLPATTNTEGQKAISLISKAEMQTRYEHQMEMVDNLRENEIEYAWISSHVNCSKRCEKWQGKLVALTGHATQSGFRMSEKLDGHTVYSLTDIMDQTDKYGYRNNIICGFNCRHRLIPYKSGSIAPREYSERSIKKQRQIETKIRAIEREIVALKEQRNLYKTMGDFESVKTYDMIIKKKVDFYKNYCERNGYAWIPFRIGQGVL